MALTKGQKLGIGVLIGLIVVGIIAYFRKPVVNNFVAKTPAKALPEIELQEDACGNLLDQYGNCFGVCFLPCEASNQDVQTATQNPVKTTTVANDLDASFDPTYWKTLQKDGKFNPSSQDEAIAEIEAKKIYDSLGVSFLNLFQKNDTETVYKIFRDAKTKANVSLMADKFKEDNSFRGLELYSFLKRHLEPEELKKLVSIVNNLPTT